LEKRDNGFAVFGARIKLRKQERSEASDSSQAGGTDASAFVLG
jgi:hypothetical protein